MINVRCEPEAPSRLEAADQASAPGAAWVRVWTQVLLLGFLTGRPLPMVPDALRTAWRAMDPGRWQATIAVSSERAVASRASVLRPSYPPGALSSVLAGVAGDLLDGRAAPVRAGRTWVPPQLRWAHEASRAGWGLAGVAGWELAPPLDFALAGLPDWPGIRAADRLDMLLRHPLSFRRPGNRELAATALFGAEGRAAFDADLATVLPRAARPVQEASRLMDCPGDWLVTVVQWAS